MSDMNDMDLIFVNITGPGDYDELVDGGKEAIARAGYSVGDFQLEQQFEDGICGNLEVDPQLSRRLEEHGWLKIEHGYYTVEADSG